MPNIRPGFGWVQHIRTPGLAKTAVEPQLRRSKNIRFLEKNSGGCTSPESPHPVDPCSLYRCDVRKRLVITPRSSAENDAVVANFLLRARAARLCHFHSGLKMVVRRQDQESPLWTGMSGGRVCNPGHPAPEIRSVGLVLLAVPSVLQASPAPHAQPNPPGSGPAVPALGIGLPSPAGQCVGVSTVQAPSLGSLKVSSSRWSP